MKHISARFLAFLFLCVTCQAYAAPIKVAFTGDQNVGSNAEAVLRLIRDEGTDLLLIQGDLGYNENSAGRWHSNLVNALGEGFPVLAVVGNHENFEWPLYKAYLQNRINRNGQLECTGDTGVKALCQFGNLEIVQVSPGISEVNGVLAQDDYADFIRESFAQPTDRWRICTWHKNMTALQTGNKGNSTGWEVYDACLNVGAMVAVAHEHAYSRSHLLSNFETQSVVHRDSKMTLEPGKSFVVVSGLGGREVRPQVRGGDWWASVYTATQGAKHGALFCTFEDSTADCYFKSVNGDIPDRFSLVRGQSDTSSVNSTVYSNTDTDDLGSGYVFSRSDKSEFRWIAKSPNGGLGNIWIDANCAQRLGGPVTSGDWGDLDRLAPHHDSISSPCDGEAVSTIASTNPSNDSGYVFSRTDKVEYRWIAKDASGRMANTWIDQNCANRLGGPAASGDWGDLDDIAPIHDGIANPCNNRTTLAMNNTAVDDEGYVFSRTDKNELRWIQVNQSGGMGSVWIDADCATRLGGASASGDWNELMVQAPGIDTVAYPCQ